MPAVNPAFWTDHLRRTLARYDTSLIRQVAARLIRPRNQWPVEELIERMVGGADNAALIDRRLQDLDAPARKLLAFMAHSRQPRWRLGSLLELLAAVGQAEGMLPVFALLEAGLLYPDLAAPRLSSAEPARDGGPMRLKSFEHWVGLASATQFTVFAHPHVLERAFGEDLGLPELPSQGDITGSVQEADGLEWPLRMAAVWQTAATPLRLTQQGDFFKRDLDRLREDALLNSAPAEGLADLPDLGLLAMALARGEGHVQQEQGELRAARFPDAWNGGLADVLGSLWSSLPHLDWWNPLDGWVGRPEGGNPYSSAYLLAMLLLARLSEGAWTSPAGVGQWVLEHHPYWSAESVRPSRLKNWMPAFLLGLAYQLGLVQAGRDANGEWLVRLSPLARWALGLAPIPTRPPSFAQTLTVQPNLEIVVYRQGLTPNLVARLSHFATWKSLGSACTLQLQPETVYRALEAGETFDTILQTLEQHGMRPTPAAVKDSLRTWANKRERISIYPSATLMEFASPEDLNEAFARGLPAARLSDRLALVANEAGIDFRHFRLTATRDYGLPPEKCVEVEADGVTLAVDLSRSDLLLETELPRFAERLERPNANGKRLYRLTPESLAAGRGQGLGLSALETWFRQRTGQPLTPAARLLLTAGEFAAPALRRHLILHVPTADIADGLLQWPGTRALIEERLGPTALSVREENAEALCARLVGLGIALE